MSSRRRRTRRSLFWGGVTLAVLLALGAVVWALARSPLFALQEVRIEGTEYVPEAAIRSFLDANIGRGPVSRWFGPRNLLAWPGGFSVEALAEGLPSVISADVQKHYFKRTAVVTVAVRKRAGQWCFVNSEVPRCFWFDDAGVLFLDGYPSEGNLTPVVRDYSRAPLVLGQAAMPERFMPSLLTVFGALQAMPLSVREIRLDDLALEEVTVRTYDGPRLLFSLRHSAAPAPDAITALAKVARLGELEYIDFRVENKVYYR